MSPEGWVELAALGLAVAAVWLSIPRPPALAWERLWKVGLAVITAGEVERSLGSTDARAREEWASRVLGAIPWHPAGRLAERKLADPRLEEIPVPALEGERALVEELAALPDARARFQRLYVDDPRAREELLGDPAALGQDHDPAALLGPSASWDEVAAWSPALQELLARRLEDVVLVVAGLPPELSAALKAAVPGLRLRVLELLPADPTSAAAVDHLLVQVEAALRADSDRVLLVGQGAALQALLAAMAGGAGLRDRCLAVLSLGGELQAPGFSAWLDEHFTHDGFDTELRRATPFMAVVDVDPADPLARPWRQQRFPQPPDTPQGHAPIQAQDLGPLHLSGIEPVVLARGILLLLALRLAAQG